MTSNESFLGIQYSVILVYLCVSVPTSLALKLIFVDLKRVHFFLHCPKAQMHDAILAMMCRSGHFPNSAIPSSAFSYSVICILYSAFY